MEASEYGHFPQQATPERRLSCDPFIVEDLLDFSNHDCVSFDNQFHHTNTTNNNNPSSSSLPPNNNNTHHSNCNSDSSNVVTPVDSCNSSFSGNNDIVLAPPSDNASHFSGELCVPYDDLAELEWLSNFVEESFSSEDLHKFQLIPTMSLSAMKTRPDEGSETRYYPSQPVKTEPAVPTSPLFSPEMPVPGKARSKRSRNAPCNWASRLLVVSPEASEHVPATKPIKPAGPKKKNMGLGGVGPMVNSTPNGEVRKCLHCATDKTPQWRTGPMGPKTLCNACGVRYKSGRLVPEYRPAASPTFMLTKHSNSHRKVMELRRQKEFQRQQHVHHQHQHQHQHQQQYQHQLIHHNPEITSSMLFDPSSTDDYLIHQHIGPDFRQLI